MISWVPYDLENARASMMRWSTLEQRGLWSCGFMQGATGAILMGGEPEAFLDGYAAGSAARENSDEYRKEQVADKRKAAARKRWDANGHANGMQNHANAAQNRTNSRERSDANDMQTAMQTACKSDANGHAKAMQNDATRQDSTRQDSTRQDNDNNSSSVFVNSAPAPEADGVGTALPTDSAAAPALRVEDTPAAPAWPKGLDPRAIPTRYAYLAACRQRFPRWQDKFAAATWDAWKRNGWRDGLDQPIHNWQRLTEVWYRGADETQKFEPLPIGAALRSVAPDLSSMRFQA